MYPSAIASAAMRQDPSFFKKIGVFHAISSIFDVVLTPTGGLAAAVSTEK